LHLFFLRHGKAEDIYAGITDADRKLTPEGIDEMRAEALALATLNPRFDLIYTSPYPRALETARIVAEAVELIHGQSADELGAQTETVDRQQTVGDELERRTLLRCRHRRERVAAAARVIAHVDDAADIFRADDAGITQLGKACKKVAP